MQKDSEEKTHYKLCKLRKFNVYD